MIPVLQQMFMPVAPPAPVGPAENTALSSAENADALGSDDPNVMGGFAAVFVGQDVAKPDTAAENAPHLGDNTDISAEVLMESGAIFAVRLPAVPKALAPLGADFAQARADSSTMDLPHISATEGALVPDHTTLAEGVVDQAAGMKTTFGSDLQQQFSLPETAQGIAAEPISPTKIAPVQAMTAPPDQVDAGLNANPIEQQTPLTQQAASLLTGLPLTGLPLTGPLLPEPPLTNPQPSLPALAQAPKSEPIFSNPLGKSIGESMFLTQIDAQDVAITTPVAVATVIPRKPVPSFLGTMAVLQADQAMAGGDFKTDGIPATLAGLIETQNHPDATQISSPIPADDGSEADLVPSAASVVAQDKLQNLAQNLGADGQLLANKTEVAPLQTPAPNQIALAPHMAQNLAAHFAPNLAAQILPHGHAAKTGPIEVLLNPAELGHLRFEIHQKGDHVQVVLSAERPETLDLLRRNGEQLAAEFRTAGFAGASFSFGQWGRSSDGQPPASFIANAEDDVSPIVLTPSAKPRIAQDNSRNLNLRL